MKGKAMKTAFALLLGLVFLAGCSSTLGFGDDGGVGVKGTIAKDGKIVSIESTDGEGNAK